MHIRRLYKKLDDAEAYARLIRRDSGTRVSVFGEEYDKEKPPSSSQKKEGDAGAGVEAGGSGRHYIVQHAAAYYHDFIRRPPLLRRTHEQWSRDEPLRLFFDIELKGDLAEVEPRVLETVELIRQAASDEFTARGWDLDALSHYRQQLWTSSREGKASKHLIYTDCWFKDGYSLAAFVLQLVKRGANRHAAIDMGLYGSSRASLRLPYSTSARALGHLLIPAAAAAAAGAAGQEEPPDILLFLDSLVIGCAKPPPPLFEIENARKLTIEARKLAKRAKAAAATAASASQPAQGREPEPEEGGLAPEEEVARRFVLRRWPTTVIEARTSLEDNEFVLVCQCLCRSEGRSAASCRCAPCARKRAPHTSNRIMLVVEMPPRAIIRELRALRGVHHSLRPVCRWKCMDVTDCGRCCWMPEEDEREICRLVTECYFPIAAAAAASASASAPTRPREDLAAAAAAAAAAAVQHQGREHPGPEDDE